MRRPGFSTVPVLLVAMLACNGVDEPAPIVLPPADPGQLIPGYPAVLDFPNQGWDLERNAIIVIEPKPPATDILRVDLDTRAPSLILSTTGFVQQLRSGGSGVVLYSVAAGDMWSLHSVDGGKVAGVGRVQFALSDNGLWAVFYDGGWQLLELATGARVALPATSNNSPPLAVSNDGSRVAFSYSFDNVVSIVTVSTGAVTPMQLSGRMLDAVFEGSDLHVLTVEGPLTGGATTSRFYDRSSSGTVVPLGMVTPHAGSGWDNLTCGAWSRGESARTAVVAVQMTHSYESNPQRFNFVRLGENPEIVGSADLSAVPECDLSPDGVWFVYGSYPSVGPGKLYLKKIK